MLYKTNYPQEDENTSHLPFRSMSGLFFTLFIFEKHVYWERRHPEQSSRVAPQENKFPQVIFLHLARFRVSGRSGLLVTSTMAEQGSLFPHPPARHIAGIPGLVPNRLLFHVFTCGKRAGPALIGGWSRRGENMNLLR